MTRLLVVDAHATVRRGLRQILAETTLRYEIGEASTVNEGIRKLRTGRWDLVLLGLSLPGTNGLDALKKIRREWPDMKVLMLMTGSEAQWSGRALRDGAAGHLAKSCPPDMLIAAIERLARGGKYTPQPPAERLSDTVGTPAGREPHEAGADRNSRSFGLPAE